MNKTFTTKGSPGRLPYLPSFKGVMETRHYMPGRLRLYIPLLMENPEAVDLLREKMGQMEPVQTIEANRMTGSLLIRFDPSKVPPTILFGATAKILGLDHEIGAKSEALLWREFKAAGEALNDAIYSYSGGILDLKTLVALGLMGTIGVGLVKRELRWSSPGVFTLGWWTYRHLFAEGPE